MFVTLPHPFVCCNMREPNAEANGQCMCEQSLLMRTIIVGVAPCVCKRACQAKVDRSVDARCNDLSGRGQILRDAYRTCEVIGCAEREDTNRQVAVHYICNQVTYQPITARRYH